jgi:hypothetical protein
VKLCLPESFVVAKSFCSVFIDWQRHYSEHEMVRRTDGVVINSPASEGDAGRIAHRALKD